MHYLFYFPRKDQHIANLLSPSTLRHASTCCCLGASLLFPLLSSPPCASTTLFYNALDITSITPAIKTVGLVVLRNFKLFPFSSTQVLFRLSFLPSLSTLLLSHTTCDHTTLHHTHLMQADPVWSQYVSLRQYGRSTTGTQAACLQLSHAQRSQIAQINVQ
jgi:hypothetical protein